MAVHQPTRLLPPQTVVDTFRSYERAGLSWGGFLLLRESERKKLHRHCNASQSVRDSLEVAVAHDMRKLQVNRDAFSNEIAAALANTIKREPRELYVGIKNQSSTCYLNALLQALFNLTYFRHVLYDMGPRPEATTGFSIPTALQRLFFALQMMEVGVTTTELTQAFGWDARQTVIQHDIHELTRKLLEELESQLAGTPRHDAIKSMMMGKVVRHICCLDADHVSTREEPFYDLELVVKGNASIQASFTEMCRTERFDFKYTYEHPDGSKTQHDAEQRTAIRQLPAILMCHPNRLEFDMNTFQRKTINDRWEFPNEIDLGAFVEAPQTAEAAEDGMSRRELSEEWRRENSLNTGVETTYVLNSVVIHSGGAGFGHYYCVVRHRDRWIKLNDESVTELTQAELEAEAFGGSRKYKDIYGYVTEYPATTRCAMLFYVNKSVFNKVIFDSDPAALPSYLHAHHSERKRVLEEEKLVKQRDAEMVPFECLGSTLNPDYLHGFGEKDRRTTIKALPSGTVSDLTALWAATQTPAADPSLWAVWSYHPYFIYDGYRGQSYAATKLDPRASISSIKGYSQYERRFLFFCPESTADGATPPMLLHVSKITGGDAPRIEYVGTVQSLAAFKRDHCTADTKIFVALGTSERYDELRDASQLISGDRVTVGTPEHTIKTVSRAYDRLYHSFEVTVYRLAPSGAPVEMGTVVLTEKMNYPEAQETVFRFLATCEATDFELPISPLHLGIRKHDSASDHPHRYLCTTTSYWSQREPATVKEMLTSGAWGLIARLYWTPLPAPMTEVEKSHLECVYSVGDVLAQHLFIPITGLNTFADLFAEARRLVPHRSSKALRAIESYSHSLVGESYDNPEKPTPRTWRVVGLIFDELPEPAANDHSIDGHPPIRVDVVNAVRRTAEEYHGLPTSIWVNKCDTGESIVSKIVTKLEVPEEQRPAALKWRLYYHNSRGSQLVRATDLVYDLVKHWTPSRSGYDFWVIERPDTLGGSAQTKARAPEPELRLRKHTAP